MPEKICEICGRICVISEKFIHDCRSLVVWALKQVDENKKSQLVASRLLYELFSFLLHHLSKVLIEIRYGVDSVKELLQREVLIW